MKHSLSLSFLFSCAPSFQHPHSIGRMLEPTRLLRGSLAAIYALALHGLAIGQSQVHLEGCFLVDDVHGNQPVDGAGPVVVGFPAHLLGNFEFQLPPAEVAPSGAFVLPRLDVLWRVNDTTQGPVSVKGIEDGAEYIPEEWCRSPLEHSAISITRFDTTIGSGVCRLDIPFGRALDERVYPFLNHVTGNLDLAIGRTAHLDLDPSTGQPTGVMFTATKSFATTAPEVVVDILRPRLAYGEKCIAAVCARTESQVDRTYALTCTVQGMLAGLPDGVTIAAGERMALIVYAPLHEGNYQIEASDPASGALLGYSTVATVSNEGELPPKSTIPGTAPPPSDAFPPDGYSPDGTYSTSLEGAPTFTWPGELPLLAEMCIPAKVFTRNAADHCSDCHRTPLSEEEKPDCPEDLLFYWVHKCVTYLRGPDDPFTYCVQAGKTLTLNLYTWTGSRGEYHCFSGELSFGQWVQATIGFDFAKSCCTYKKSGDTQNKNIPTCETW